MLIPSVPAGEISHFLPKRAFPFFANTLMLLTNQYNNEGRIKDDRTDGETK